MVELEIDSIRAARALGTPVLVLREHDGPRLIPIWIGVAEADAILRATAGTTSGMTAYYRSMHHALTRDGQTVQGAVLTSVDDGIYSAAVVVDGRRLEARASDSIALAVVSGAPISCEPHVLDEAGVMLAHDRTSVVEMFHAFIDAVDPDDFRTLK